MREAVYNYNIIEKEKSKKKVRFFKKHYVSKNRFIKLWNGWDSHSVFEEREEFKKIFKSLITLANVETKVKIKKNHKFEVKRGQVFTSLSKIKEHAGVSKKNVETALKKFEENEMILNESFDGIGRIITIINYSKYQDKDVVHENVIYLDKHEDLNFRHKGEASEKLVGSSYTLDRKDNKENDIKKVSTYKDRPTFFLKNKKEKEENKIVTIFKKAFVNAFKLDPNSNITNELKNSMSVKRKKKLIEFFEEKQITQEQADIVLEKIAEPYSNEDLKFKLSYFIDRIIETFDIILKKNEEKQEEIKKQKLPVVKITLSKEIKEVNENFKKEVKNLFTETVANYWILDKAIILGFEDDGKTPILLICNYQVKSYVSLTANTRLERVLSKILKRTLNNPKFILYDTNDYEKFEISYD